MFKWGYSGRVLNFIWQGTAAELIFVNIYDYEMEIRKF
jgi:hypothetical protein